MINMEADQAVMEIITDIVGHLWYIITYLVGTLITAFIGIVIDYMTGKIISNVQYMTLGFIFLATAWILYLRFVR